MALVNYVDATLTAILTEQGHRNAATAAMYETLAGEWLRFSASSTEGSISVDAKEVSDNYFAMAMEWRDKPGGAGPDKILKTGYWPVERVDQYNAA